MEVNISIIIRLSWNQFRCLVQYGVHKRITVSSEQGQGKNKQMFVIHVYCIIRFTSLHYATTFHLLELLAEAFQCHVHHF